MKTVVTLLLSLCVGVLLVAGITAAAGSKATAADDGWIRLFDGTTLTGWKASEKPENWKVEDGCIVGTGDRSHLFYVAEEFKNFHFKADVLTQPKTNSGIYFHSKYQEGGWPNIGYESQVNVSHGDPVKTGSLYNVVKLINFTPCKDGQWWTQHIIVKGKAITTMIEIEGTVVFQYEYVEPGDVNKERKPGPRVLSQGLFAFQQHDPGSVVKYRNVMVQKLR